jgi:antitoxin component YwqK of YwqJK toxin-antitoxin module
MKPSTQKPNGLFSLIAFLLFVAFAADLSAKELNLIDDQGRKQGYWIIKGYMVDSDEYSPNSTIEEGSYKNNLKDGLWTRYYPNGVVKSEINYENNKPRGEYSIFYRNAQLEEHGHWQRNKNIGEFERYYKNGNPQQKFFFSDNGLRYGEQRYYHENGQLWLEVNVVNGKEEGEMKRYFANGKLKERKVFHNGEVDPKSVRTYGGNAPSQPVITVEQEKESITEEPVVVPEEGTTNESVPFKANGFNTIYNNNDQISQVGQYNEGQLWNGKWYQYNKDGILIRIEVYKDGKYVGNGLIEK